MRQSEINTYINCPQRYQYEYELGLKSEIKSIDLEFGTAIHESIECAFEGLDPVIVFKDYWERFESSDLDTIKYNWTNLYSIGERFLIKFMDRHYKHFEKKEVEYDFSISHNGRDYTGAIDFVGLYKGIPSIVDFKTSDRAYDKYKIDANLQLYLYALAAQKQLTFDVKQIIYLVFVKSDGRIQTIIKDITKKDIDYHISNAEIIYDLIKSGAFYKNYQSCNYCNFKKECWK